MPDIPPSAANISNPRFDYPENIKAYFQSPWEKPALATDIPATATLPRWRAGSVDKCVGGSDHRVANVHVIVRCVCGAAFMSTDGGIALGMAQAHEEKP